MPKKSNSPVILILAAVCILFFPSSSGLCQAIAVPSEYRDLYSELDEELSRVEALFNERQQVSEYPVIFGAQLIGADAKRTQELLKAGQYESLLLELDRLKEMGIQLVTISVGFPNLYRAFYKNREDYDAYLDFYKRLAKDIRSRGMKLVIEAQPLPDKLGVSQESTELSAFLRKFKFKEYLKARCLALVNIARELEPDYISIISEPDTEAMLGGQPIDDPQNSVLLVNTALQGFKKAKIKGVSTGAGVGIWHPRYRAFVLSFAQCRRLNFIDLHVYPVNLGLLERVEESADIAIRRGKQIAISEAWLYKCRIRELGRGLDDAEIFSRDTFSFWEALDKKFVRVMNGLVRANQYEFISFFWSKYFHAYLDYGKIKELSPIQIADISSAQTANSLVYDKYTGLAGSLSAMIKEGRGAVK